MDQHRIGTERRLALGGCALLIVGGGGLIALLDGGGAALVAVGIVALTFGLGVLIWLLLSLLQRWVE